MENESLVIKPRRPKGEDGYRVFSIRIKEDIIARIDDISTQTGHSRNELISTFIEHALNRCVIEAENNE